ncbi:MAG: extracellular solute-binding protein [Caldilineales bacterium]|nr:extracellular solute-binding protein [Caldilineales bacterium]
MNKLKLFVLLVSLVAFGALLAACAMPTPQVVERVVVVTPTPEPEARKLEIFHWWTAPGEREAADAMFAALKAAYPDIEVIENPVAGGGGVSHRVVLQGRIAAGIPPDTFQTLGGAELKQYVDGGVLQPLDDLWKELNYYDVIPGPLAKAVSVGGRPYVVPLNMHIQNILYYNKKLFDELKLTPPTTFDELIAACEAIKKAQPDMVCLGLGSKEKWGDAFVFDSIYLEEAGPENYVKLYKGELDVTQDAAYRRSLEKLQQLIPYVNTDHFSLTWDQAVGLVGSEKAAMTIMGTWAIGAFVKGSGWEPGVDFGAVTFPQKPDRILLFHPDTYGLTVGAPHPKTTMDWLRVVASPELQIPTDVIQGGLFARTDIDPTEFPDPIRQEMQTFVRNNPDKLILDQHGSILPGTATPIYWDIIASFMAQPDVDGTIQAVANMMTTYDVKNASAWYQWP